jgi:hypothetical protein
MTLWSVQYLYVGLLRGTSQSENKQLALAAGETVYKVWQNRVQGSWSEDPGGLDTDIVIQDSFQEMAYRVEVGPRVDNPTYESGDPISQAKLQLRPLLVRVQYEDRGVKKELKLNGAVSK